MRHLTAAPIDVAAVQWGPSWNGMLEAAESLGRLGFIFDIHYSSPEDRRRGVDVFPELRLLDSRYRQHIVTQGLWVVIYPGHREFRIVTTGQLESEYQEREPE